MIHTGEVPSAWLSMVQNQHFLNIGVRDHRLPLNAMHRRELVIGATYRETVCQISRM